MQLTPATQEPGPVLDTVHSVTGRQLSISVACPHTDQSCALWRGPFFFLLWCGSNSQCHSDTQPREGWGDTWAHGREGTLFLE